MINLPEVILKKALDIYLGFLKTDIKAHLPSDTANTYLARIYEGMGIDKYDFLQQGLKIFNPAADEPRLFEIDLMYNMKANRTPNAFIMLGGQSQSSVNAIGLGEGYLGSQFVETSQDDTPDDDTDPDNDPDADTDEFDEYETYSRRMTNTLNLVIISENSNEVLLIYYTLQAGLIALLPHLSLSGFENLRLSGQDFYTQDADPVPKNLYKRALQLNFEYNTSSIDWSQNKVYKDIEFQLQQIYEN